MLIKQLSIFVENQSGRLAEITSVMADAGIDIRAASIADTTDFGILRLIVDDPDRACEALKAAGLTVSLTNVIAIGIKDEPGGLSDAVKILSDSGISIEYVYGFVSRDSDYAYIVLRVEDNGKAVDVLLKNNIKVLSSKDMYNM